MIFIDPVCLMEVYPVSFITNKTDNTEVAEMKRTELWKWKKF